MTNAAALLPLTSDQRRHFSWLDAPHLKSVVAALEAADPGGARFVGGCVRDSLMGIAPKDFDMATRLPPDAAMTALKTAGLGVAPTGIDHGTVTAISDHQGVEVTTLRADVSTDGRRATVAYTRDWATDAGRRDFTINAIYLTPGGELYDPVGGVADSRARAVRFIGEPQARIREDYLRILRFFRFSARFCTTFDDAGLAACATLRSGLKNLSAERIGAEMSGVLSLPRAGMALSAMSETKILKEIWPAPPDLDAADRMKAADPHASAPLMLAALYGEAGAGLGAALRLSNAEKAIRTRALTAVAQIDASLSEQQMRALIYQQGKDGFADALLLAASHGVVSPADYHRMRAYADGYTPPPLAISGKDIVAAGIVPGPRVSKLLKAIEALWIEEDFPEPARQKEILAAALAKS
ncbi:MAG: CCA tRNA nucleotidyltransferase [Pseudomonadota bacterium]